MFRLENVSQLSNDLSAVPSCIHVHSIMHSPLFSFQHKAANHCYHYCLLHLKLQMCVSCSCPGVFSGQGCGAKLKWVQFREGKGCWGCASWPACDYKEAATERLATPQVTLEAVSKELFKVLAPSPVAAFSRFTQPKSLLP